MEETKPGGKEGKKMKGTRKERRNQEIMEGTPGSKERKRKGRKKDMKTKERSIEETK